MKKLLSLAVLLAVVCSSAFLFAGCQSSNGKIEISGGPFTYQVFVEEESEIPGDIQHMTRVENELKNITFNLKDEEGNVVETLTIYDAKLKGASVTGFSLRTTGTRTARLSYKGVSQTFEYTVN